MRSSPRGAAWPVSLATWLATALVAGPARADTAAATATLHVQVQARTALRLSSSVLEFIVTGPDAAANPPQAVLAFEAAARTRTGGDVVLSIEPAGPLSGPFGAADVDTVLTFRGDGDGTASGTLAWREARVAGRWTGSGKRQGQLVFSLRGALNPGTYTLPVRLVLTAP